MYDKVHFKDESSTTCKYVLTVVPCEVTYNVGTVSKRRRRADSTSAELMLVLQASYLPLALLGPSSSRLLFVPNLHLLLESEVQVSMTNFITTYAEYCFSLLATTCESDY